MSQPNVPSESALLEIYAIQQLKYRYLRALDTQDWDLMTACFAEDAHVWYNNGLHKFEGRATIVGFFKLYLDSHLFTSHVAVHPEIALTGPTTASGIWRFQDIVLNVQPDESIRQPGKIRGGQRLEGAGYYHDEYVKRGGTWAIQSSGYVRIYESASRPGYRYVDDADHDSDSFLRTVALRGKRT